MPTAPSIIVFDVNETLSDLEPLRSRFTDVGAPAGLLDTWFAGTLRDGFGLAAAGTSARFLDIARGVLAGLLSGVPLDRPLGEAVDHVVGAMSGLDVHEDVPDAVRRMRASGLRLVTLTNGSTSMSEAMFERAGIRQELEQLLSVDDAGAWKPARRAYEHAAQQCGVPLQRMLMVAVHPWDTDGAARAGMRSAWVDRSGRPFPSYLQRPTLIAGSMTEVADALTG